MPESYASWRSKQVDAPSRWSKRHGSAGQPHKNQKGFGRLQGAICCTTQAAEAGDQVPILVGVRAG
jgi:hypothetical protein